MISHRRKQRAERRGAIAVLAAFLIPVLAGIVAFAVDYGYLVKTRSDMQRAVDAATLAAAQSILSDDDESGDVETVREVARDYAVRNLGTFTIADSDIEMGRFDPTTINVAPTLLSTGTFDTVRVTLRRDGESNSRAPLFFARVFGQTDASLVVTATACLQKAQSISAGADVLPFATPEAVWDTKSVGDEWSVYGDGKMKDANGNDIPGNWGTLDIGPSNNSTSDLNDQILNGLRQSDLDTLYSDGRIAQSTHIDSSAATWLNADTGLSSGLKHSVQQIHGTKRLVPIFAESNGAGGNNLEYKVVKWGVVTVVDSNWQGSKNTYVKVRKARTYDGNLQAVGSLSSTTGGIEGAYTSPVLIE